MPALTTLAKVREWVYISGDGTEPGTTDDNLLQRLIDTCSAGILSYLQRPSLVKTDYSELRDGVGNQAMMLRNWPVTSLQSVKYSNVTVPISSGFPAAGCTLGQWDGSTPGKPQNVTLVGYSYPQGYNNVLFDYTAGYWIANEQQIITDNNNAVTAQTWSQDEGVTYANGTALVKVPTSPAVGQYTVNNCGVYGFNSAESGTVVLISYSYIPHDLEQACIEWVGERYRYRDRIGQRSKSLGGNETSSYDLSGIPSFIAAMCLPYKKQFHL